MFKNVIIYQLKDSSNRWAAISAYVPKDQADFERVCWINANDKGETINVVDMKDFDTVEDISNCIDTYSWLQETDPYYDKSEIFFA